MNKKWITGISSLLVLCDLAVLIMSEIMKESKIQIIQHIIFWVIFTIWIFLILRLWTKDQQTLNIRLSRLKVFMFTGFVSWAVMYLFYPQVWLALTGLDEWAGAIFYIPVILILLIIIGTIGSLVLFIKARRNSTIESPKS